MQISLPGRPWHLGGPTCSNVRYLPLWLRPCIGQVGICVTGGRVYLLLAASDLASTPRTSYLGAVSEATACEQSRARRDSLEQLRPNRTDKLASCVHWKCAALMVSGGGLLQSWRELRWVPATSIETRRLRSPRHVFHRRNHHPRWLRQLDLQSRQYQHVRAPRWRQHEHPPTPKYLGKVSPRRKVTPKHYVTRLPLGVHMFSFVL